jgi:ribosome biogenesis protein ENP2
MKCERGLDTDIVRFCILEEGYRKLALAGSDRTIEIHA